MEFINHTPFPALAFGGVDPHRQAFHVVVLRQTLTWNDAGELIFADEQAPLCEADEYFGEEGQGSVRQESDLCQYKPKCDVIVNATAYPPRPPDGAVVRQFQLRLEVRRPGPPVALPPEPHGLNPLTAPTPAQRQAWQAEVERIRWTAGGEHLIDKTLTCTGARRFIKHTGWRRLAAALKLLPSPWQLIGPAPAGPVPVRLEHAFGGQCRIAADHPVADHVAHKHRLSPEQVAAHPDTEQPPLAHEALAANPVGFGYTRDWYLDAIVPDSVAAPPIEDPATPLTVERFEQMRTGHLEHAAALVAGLGVRPKGHPARAKLVGTIDRTFIEGDAPLPEDFDFAVWNAAWPDQQVDALQGDEVIQLTNLCAPHTPAAACDGQGNIRLRLALPGHLPFVLVRFESGALGELEARLDTLIIDPEARQVALVWRATVATEPAIRVLEARLIAREEIAALRRAPAATAQAQPPPREAHG